MRLKDRHTDDVADPQTDILRPAFLGKLGQARHHLAKDSGHFRCDLHQRVWKTSRVALACLDVPAFGSACRHKAAATEQKRSQNDQMKTCSHATAPKTWLPYGNRKRNCMT